MKYNDITQHEIEALKHQFNMSDAHTHQSQSPSQKEIVNRLPDLWYASEQQKQIDIEQEFLTNFFRVHKRPSAMTGTKPMLIYASSIAMVATANYLAKKKYSVALMHPCFDNIKDILRNMDIPLDPLEESWLSDSKKIYNTLAKNITADALFIVEPNNPTGTSLFAQGKDSWKELIRYAKDHNKILLFDFCFTAFLLKKHEDTLFDLYEILDESGVSYITYEDTGKTFPLQDAKVAILKTSKDLFQDVYNIHTSYLLNVSPFILSIVNEYILDAERTRFESVHTLLEKNRITAQELLAHSILEPIPQLCEIPVLWCKVKEQNIKATELKEYLEQHGVHVLPGTYFYWNNEGLGESFVRIALARNTDMFESGIKKMITLLNNYKK